MNMMKHFRKKAGYSQGTLARKMGLSNTTIVLIEDGYNASYPKFRRGLSEVLGVKEDQIFCKDGRVIDNGEPTQ